MSTRIFSDAKPWNYEWIIPFECPMILARYKAELALDMGSLRSPQSKLALINLATKPRLYTPVLVYDISLESKGVEARYFTDNTETSEIARDFFSNVMESAEKVGMTYDELLPEKQNLKELPKYINKLKTLEDKFKVRNFKEELNALTNIRKFCEVVQLNKCGLHIS